MRRPADPARPLTKQLNIAVSQQLLDDLVAEVRALGTTQSQFARAAIERRLTELQSHRDLQS